MILAVEMIGSQPRIQDDRLPRVRSRPQCRNFLFAVKFDPQMKEMGGAQSSSARHFAAAFFCGLEGVSQAEIDLDKIFHSGIEVVIPAADVR